MSSGQRLSLSETETVSVRDRECPRQRVSLYLDQNACTMSYMAQFPRQEYVGACAHGGSGGPCPPRGGSGGASPPQGSRGVWGAAGPPRGVGVRKGVLRPPPPGVFFSSRTPSRIDVGVLGRAQTGNVQQSKYHFNPIARNQRISLSFGFDFRSNTPRGSAD